MAQSAEEKRRAPRHSYAYSVTYMGKVSTPGASHQEVPFQGKIVDLSNGGLGMQTRGHPFLEIGSPGPARIPLSPPPGDVPGFTPPPGGRGKGACARPPVRPLYVLSKTTPPPAPPTPSSS